LIWKIASISMAVPPSTDAQPRALWGVLSNGEQATDIDLNTL